MARKNKSQPLVGIDISSTAVKVVQIGLSGGRYRIDHYAIEPLQPGWVDDKAIVEGEQVAAVIEKALKSARIKSRAAVVAVSGNGVITKIIQVPGVMGMPEHELQDQVELEAANHIPFQVEEVRIDFSVIGPSSTEGVLNVLLAAVRNDTANLVQETAEMAGLTVDIMDVESLALETAYNIVADELKIPEDDLVAMFDIGASVITLNVMHQGNSIFQRQQPFDTKALETELRRQMGCSQEDALGHLRAAEFPAGFEQSVLEPFRDGLVQSLGRLLQYFYSATEFNTIHKILLSGGGASTHGLPEALDDRLGIPSSVANPLASMALGSGVKGQDLATDAPSLFLATGLALRSFRREKGINLMPWREKRTQERNRAFVSLVGMAALVAVALLAGGWLIRAGQIDVQESRNTKLTQEIDLMKARVAEIQDLDVKRERLLGRKQVIEELQSNRSHMVHLFDQLVRTVPEGIMLVSVNQRGAALTVEGRSESNSRVSEYLRRLDDSPWLARADLKIIEEQSTPSSRGAGGRQVASELPYLFRLQVTQVNPNAPSYNEDGELVEPAAALEESPLDDPDAPLQDEQVGASDAPALESGEEGLQEEGLDQAVEVGDLVLDGSELEGDVPQEARTQDGNTQADLGSGAPVAAEQAPTLEGEVEEEESDVPSEDPPPGEDSEEPPVSEEN